MSDHVPVEDNKTSMAAAARSQGVETENAEEGGRGADSDLDEELSKSWFDFDREDRDVHTGFKDYEITSSPNDFNIKTIVDFVNSGVVKIPGFQRNYIWDIKRASKLIESLLIGLPIPQLFLYEENRNAFLVIDGQQRLMSIYYFVKGRFPKKDKRPQLRRIMDKQATPSIALMADDEYFQKFNLSLSSKVGGTSRFHGKNYDTLEEAKLSFDLRTIRNVVLKQTSPKEEQDTAIFEIFNRLNTGGVNLRPQEIRSSLFHSAMIDVLHRVNLNPKWRGLIGLSDPDLHDKDVEVLLRAFALVSDNASYTEPMSRFLNQFARKARGMTHEKLKYMEDLFGAFFEAATALTAQNFAVERSGRFNIMIFEAVFWAACEDAFDAGTLHVPPLRPDQLETLKTDSKFIEATRQGVGRAMFVRQRHERTSAILKA